MHKIIILLIGILLSINTFSQTADEQYRKPLKDVLDEIQTIFNVKLNYSEDLVKDKWLNYAEWRIRRYSLEKTLTNILAPFDYVFAFDKDNIYKIKKFEYARRPDQEGADHCNYLSTLYNDKASWEARKKELRSCMIEALGLSPMPRKTNSKPIITNKRFFDGYSVENVAIETLPGLYVCGSLYRPLKHKGPCPVILNPDGHFGNGRYRADCQYRCAMEARMGAIAFNYDLFAWGESRLQFKSEDHQKSIANTIHVLNGMRILDFLLSLKGVDTTRVAVTGGSGGGSQTMQLTALDARIKFSIPVVMVSSHFFGGCPCESGMPFQLCGGGTNNAEIAAMAAPRPMLIVSDGKDWTNTVPDIELPFIKRIYGFYGLENSVENVHLIKEGHDYGLSKRLALYDFLAKYLNMDINKVKDKDGKIDETKCTIEEFLAMYVFGKNGENLPANAIKDINVLTKVLDEARKN
jgi:hypothetical protein